MAEQIKVGVFSPNDFREWVRNDNLDLMLKHEAALINALKKKGIKVIRGGDGFKKEDQIAWNTHLVRAQAKKIAQAAPDALIINEASWTFPYDSRDAVSTFMHEVKGIDAGLARVLIFSYKDTQVPGLVAGMAVGGALKRVGIPYQLVYGKIDKEPKVLNEVVSVLEFYKKRALSAPTVVKALQQLPNQKYLAFGGMSLKMPTTTADVDQWQKLFGISYEALDQSELTRRARAMVDWQGIPGKSAFIKIKDARVKNALEFCYEGKHGKFDFSQEKLKDVNMWLLQLCYYYAAIDATSEYDITFCGVKCQDELSAFECTQCLTSAFLNNDVGPDGKKKKIIPTACENDMDSSLTQLWLSLLSGKPAGFGDFRDVENGVLAIVNCGQHPPYFFGKPDEDSLEKLSRTEYIGQEIFYDAGGSAVRGRTPGKQVMTVARLGRENLKYQIVATIINTIDVPKDCHKKYNLSWPIILGKLPIPDEVMIKNWPCNHLGFAFGDYTPHLVEMAHRLDIGYKVFDASGREHYKPC